MDEELDFALRHSVCLLAINQIGAEQIDRRLFLCRRCSVQPQINQIGAEQIDRRGRFTAPMADLSAPRHLP